MAIKLQKPRIASRVLQFCWCRQKSAQSQWHLLPDPMRMRIRLVDSAN